MPTSNLRVQATIGATPILGTIAQSDATAISMGPLEGLPIAYAATIVASGTSGTLTLPVGLTYTNGDDLDIYWTDGYGVLHCACNVQAGTQSSRSLPFTAAVLFGADALPATGNVIVSKQIQMTQALTGNNIDAIFASANVNSHVTFFDGSGAINTIDGTRLAGVPFFYWSGISGSNPVAAKSLTKIGISSGNVAAAGLWNMGILYRST